MRNASTEVLTQAADRKDAGEAWNEVLTDLGLNYSQAWLFWARRTIVVNHPKLVFDTTGKGEATIGKAIAAMRNEGGEFASWGWIAVRCDLPESRVRKLFTLHTNVRHDGLRIGKGGRFVQDEGAYYTGPNRKTGVVTPKGQAHVIPTDAEEELMKRLTALNVKSLKGLAKEYGVAGAAKMSKADVVNAIIVKQREKAAAKG